MGADDIDGDEANSVAAPAPPTQPAASPVTRAVDMVGAACLLVLSAPLILFCMLLVRLTSPGPALFRQQRVGFGGESFEMLKIRTMTDGNDRHHREYVKALLTEPDAPPAANGSYKLDDPRVTPVGSVLRKLSIDELPQLWNVVRGDMSLVGPRPMLDWEFELVTGAHRRRVEVHPGMTGLWQVSGRSALTMREMLDLDVEYVDSRSVSRDLAILARTPFALLSR